ncbi:MAG TPA: hypothetical protein VL172_00915 [Kofleriaceae bacterium]|nr:hypothetical protein [Kofleriaceae bacterium]
MRAFLGLALLVAACGPSGGDGGPDGAVTDDPCTGTESRCVSNTYEVCNGSVFVQQEICASPTAECSTHLGCVACDPLRGNTTCTGDEVHTCNDDGTVGGLIETCGFEGCSGGSCGGGDCGAQGADIIYVVDEAHRLWSFDPELLPGDPYAMIGTLSCPGAGTALPGFDPLEGAATPFSMAVDRQAQAWVLYSSGKLFKVSTTDASCTATTFAVGQSSGGTTFELFGMGFVSDSPSASTDTLFISGGPADRADAGDLATLDINGLTVSRVQALPAAEYSPELTGTGAAELYGYYPGVTSLVARINKASAANDQTWSLPSLSGQVRAWAFAHWGGLFFIFITTSDGLFDTADVLRLDPMANGGAGEVTTALSDTGKIVVGAGVSTCAPIVIP